MLILLYYTFKFNFKFIAKTTMRDIHSFFNALIQNIALF